MNVSAVIVTRGDVDLEPIIATIPLAWDLVVWDNSRRENLCVYGRYAALQECEHEIVYVQDDDCVTDPSAIVAAYDAGRIVANMPPEFRRRYPDSCLIGFGAVFDRDLPARAFARYSTVKWPARMTPDFHRTCDVAFTALTERTLIDVPYWNLSHAYTAERMYRQAGHMQERRQMLKLVRMLRRQVVA